MNLFFFHNLKLFANLIFFFFILENYKINFLLCLFLKLINIFIFFNIILFHLTKIK